MKFLIIGGGQDGLILSYLISNIEGVDGKLIIRKKNQFKKYYLNTTEIGSFTNQNIFSILEVSVIAPFFIGTFKSTLNKTFFPLRSRFSFKIFFIKKIKFYEYI